MNLNKEKILEAGKIASEAKKYARTIVKKRVPLIEIAEKIEAKILELGGKPAFPVNLSIDNVAAHYTPSHDDKALAHGLIKVDLGVHIDGWVADTSFSLDLDGSDSNKKLIKSSEEALDSAIELIKKAVESTTLGEIGSIIEKKIDSYGFTPIINLSGHSIDHYNLHSGVNVPNFNNNNQEHLEYGIYAVEPFATNGSGKVHDGKPSGIYHLLSEKNPRSPIAREVISFIKKEYKELPFCSRWIVKKLGLKALFGLRELESNGNLHHFSQLVETQNAVVSQSEHTILVEKDKVSVTTL